MQYRYSSVRTAGSDSTATRPMSTVEAKAVSGGGDKPTSGEAKPEGDSSRESG